MSTKKVLLIGAAGMAGHVIKQKLELLPDYRVETLARSDSAFIPTHLVDLRDFVRLEQILDLGFDYVINCSGLLNQYAEENPDEAVLINAYLPHFLAKAGAKQGFKLIHISTDCVFSGKKGNYRVTDEKDGQGYYAQTKALGEVDYGQHLTLRTSIVGPELKNNGIGLFGWFMQQKGEINGFTEAYWSGVTTTCLAEAVIEAIEIDLKGLYQLTNNTKINKYDLLVLIQKVFDKKDAHINAVPGKKVDKSLINERMDFPFKIPNYETMLEEMRHWMKTYSTYN